jgi:hypothetical protein
MRGHGCTHAVKLCKIEVDGWILPVDFVLLLKRWGWFVAGD